jgi:hypothetical protein
MSCVAEIILKRVVIFLGATTIGMYIFPKSPIPKVLLLGFAGYVTISLITGLFITRV